MKILADSYKATGNLHHAYLIEGEGEAVRLPLRDFLEHDLKQSFDGNPDLWQGAFETLSIDDARMLRERQSTKAFGAGRKIFIIETRFATAEAQNSLLKILEEPTPNTHFFIITPHAEGFLPTLLSRLMIIRKAEWSDSDVQAETAGHSDDPDGFVSSFIKASNAERLVLIKDIVEEKDKAAAVRFVDTLIKILREKTSPEKNPFLFGELLQARTYLNDRSPSIKLILEHLALIVPPVSALLSPRE